MKMLSHSAAIILIVLGLATSRALAGAGGSELDKLVNQAVEHIGAGRFPEAAVVLEKALPLAETIHGAESPYVGVICAGLGQALSRTGLEKTVQYKRAAELLKRALSIQEKSVGKDHVDVATTLSELGRCYYFGLKNRDLAEKAFQRCIDILETQLGKEARPLELPLLCLGQIHQLKGNHLAAEPFHLRCARIAEKHNDADNLLLALGGLEGVYTHLGQFSKLQPLLERLLRLEEKSYGVNDPRLCGTLHMMGHMYWKMGQYVDAEQAFLRSADIGKKKTGAFSDDNLNTLNCLSVLYGNTGRKEESLRLRQQVFEAAEKQLPANHHFRIFLMSVLGRELLDRGELDKAEPLLAGALEKTRKNVGEDLLIGWSVRLDLALLRRRQGRLTEAEQLVRESLKMQQGRFGNSSPSLADAWAQLGHVQIQREQRQEAVQSLDTSLRILRRHVAQNLPILSPDGQLRFIAKTYEENLFVGLSFALQHPDDADLATRAAEWLVNSKGQSLECLAATNRLLLSSKNPEVAELVQSLQGARFEIAKLTLTSGDADDADKSLPSQNLGRKKLQVRELEKKLQGLIQKDLPGDPWIPLAEVRARLPRGGVLVEIVRMKVFDFSAQPGQPAWKPAHYVAWIVPPLADGAIRIVDLGDADAIDRQVQAVREQMATAAPRRGATRDDTEKPDSKKKLRDVLEPLSKTIVHPLLPELEKRPRWILGPDADLWLVPWSACLLPGGEYVVEKHAVSLVTSGRNLLPTVRPKSAPALVLADPDYDLRGTEVRRLSQAALGQPAETRDLPLSTSFVPGRAARLPGTAAEAEAALPQIKALTALEPRLLMQEKALKDVVLAQKNPAVLHLSTHGYSLPRAVSKKQAIDNPLLRCGLLLAGCNDPDYFSQGVLTAWEVTNMDLRGTWLVVLSACETGLGDIQQGEGVAGLRQSFQLAGALAVVASLWQVPDRETAELMSRFFENMAQEEDKAEALRQAQLHLLRRGPSHPYFWAAFSVTGRAHSLFPLADAITVGPKLDTAQQYLARGLSRLKEGKPRQAVGDFSAAIGLDPQLAAAYSQRAAAYRQINKSDAALTDLDKRLALEAPLAEDFLEHGKLLRALKQGDQGLADFSKTIAMTPNDADALTYRASLLHYVLRKSKEAEADLERALQLGSRSGFTWNVRGLIAMDQKQNEAAVEFFSKGIAEFPTYKFAWANRGLAHDRLNQSQKGIDDLTRAIELDPLYDFAFNERGLIHQRSNRHVSAVEDFSRCLRVNPLFVTAFANRSESQRILGKWTESIEDATQALAKSPNNFRALANRAESHRLRNEHARAIDDYTQALGVFPKNTFVLNGRGLSHMALKNPSAAESDFGKCIEADPMHKWACLNRAKVRMQQKKLNEALADATRALEIDPRFTTAYSVRAQIHRELGNVDKAEEDEKRAK
jgi:tetratricopeptide (TPR) repeat protein